MPDIKFSNKYPYTDFHELNLDWVIKEVKYWSEKVGKSILSIAKTGTVGLVDTYTVTYTDNTTYTFNVTNGNGIVSVDKTGTAGLVDTYTITFQDGTTTTFDVSNGTASIDDTLKMQGYAADAQSVGDQFDYFNNGYVILHPMIIPNSYPDGSGGFPSYNGWDRTDFIDVSEGRVVGVINTRNTYDNAWYDANHNIISRFTLPVGSPSLVMVPLNAAYMVLSNDRAQFFSKIFISQNQYTTAAEFNVVNNLIVSPWMSNGSGGNPGNANAVTARAVPFIDSVVSIVIKINRPVSSSGNYYKCDISAFKGKVWYTNRITDQLFNEYNEITFDPATVINNISDVDGFGITIWEYNSSDVLQTLRMTDFTTGDIVVRYIYPEEIQDARERDNDETFHKILNARKQPNNTGTPLTFLHFSDIHGDVNALNRIIKDAEFYGSVIDDKICTGDIVSNTYESITSWWNPDVMVCIGNHDTAAYSGGIYNWTALSMADRDTYYIAPFESNWNIVHTSGTSYYYKDYSDANVRLIVMDGMLYTNNGPEAATQTAWLESLLSDAISNGLHVMIAIHAPHGGATPENCSFDKYGQTTMPTYTDCNTPQTVIDKVATAITNGLQFIGYIVGHNHQDDIWDCENNGSQLMYCITCANTTASSQWAFSDQDRTHNVDAYNIITIDTANKLVKIVRGGGANIDDHMRTRRGVTFDYSSGTIVGEVL